jgi:hypothetical protein
VRRFCSLVACAATFAAVSEAQASRALQVSLHDCANWSPLELQRLIRLELGTVAGGESDVGSAQVSISCHDQKVVLTATDSRSRRALTRTVELETGVEGAERVLSISAAQLVRALDWLPETTPAPPPVTRAQNAEQPSKARFHGRPFQLRLGGGSRVRELPTSLVTYRLSLGSGFALGHRARVGGGVSYERGATSRQGGEVDAQLLGAALQSSLEPLASGRWSCLVGVDLALQHLTLRGRNAEPGVIAARVRGLGGEAQVSIGPALRWNDVGVALLAQGGGAYFGGKALVARDRPVSLNRVWAGAELALLWTP